VQALQATDTAKEIPDRMPWVKAISETLKRPSPHLYLASMGEAKKHRSFQARLIIGVGLLFLAFGGSLIGVSVAFARREAMERARARMTAATLAAAMPIRTKLETAMSAARTLAEILSTTKRSGVALGRDQVNAMLRRALEDNPDFFGTYTLWEPNAFDGQDARYAGTPSNDETGRFIPYWHRGGSTAISLDPLLYYETPGIGDYYLIPRRTRKESFIEPLQYPVEGKDVMMTSLIVPILDGDRYYGMAGVDYALDFLQGLANAADVFTKSGKLFLISHGGIIAGATGNPELVYENVRDVPGLAALGPGNLPHDGTIVASGGDLYASYAFSVGRADTQWSVVLRVPEREIFADADALAAILTISMAAFALVGLLAIIYLLRSLVIRRVSRLAEATRDFASGRFDTRCDMEPVDEIGRLGGAFDSMAEQVQSSYAALRDSEGRYRLLAETSNVGIIQADSELRTVYMNPTMRSLIEIEQGREVGGLMIIDYFTRESAELVRREQEKRRAGLTTTYEAILIGEKGGLRDVMVTGAPVIGADGRFSGSIATFSDISELKSSAAELRAALREKTTLLREVNHRVMNNLQILASLINQQMAISEGQSPERVLKGLQGRILAMALVYQELESEEDLSKVRLKPFLENLVAGLIGDRVGELAVSCDLADIAIDISHAMPLALAANELVANAFEHAYPPGTRGGRVAVSLTEADGLCNLEVEDWGRGSPESAGAEPSSIGLGLVRILAKQLDGSFSITMGSGSRADFSFPMPRIAAAAAV
jgi:PAS domain S-box-containing protein